LLLFPSIKHIQNSHYQIKREREIEMIDFIQKDKNVRNKYNLSLNNLISKKYVVVFLL